MTGAAGQQNWLSRSNGLKLLLILLLVLGIFFRLAHLERKIYWHDEVETSRRIAGYPKEEFIQQVFNGTEIGVVDLQKYQQLTPEKGVMDTVRCLAVEAPVHPPFYYVLARFWAEVFGDSVLAMRTLPALISLIVFPATYLLCLELFNSSLSGWVAMALIAVSPFHVLYAQEVRQYSLFTVLILLSSALLLQAMRLKTKWRWGIYALSLGFGLYTHTWFALVVIAHGVYMIGTQWKTFDIRSWLVPKVWIHYLIATFCGVLFFVPWGLILVIQGMEVRGNTSWLTATMSLPKLIKFWLLDLSFPFFDPNGSVIYRVVEGSDSLWTYIIRLPILALALYSLYFIIKNSPTRVWLLVSTLIGSVILAFALPDLLFGGIKSTVPRYLIPGYIGLQLAVAYLISAQVTSSQAKKQKFGQLISSALLLSGVISCVISFQSQAWWNKPASFDNIQVAHILNQSERPLVISDSYDFNPSNTISISYILQPHIRFQLVENPQQLKLSDFSRDIFLLNPSPTLRTYLKNELNHKIISIYKRSDSRELSRIEQ